MSLSSAMLVGFTGIKSNSVTVDTVGDNLANLNTTAFKGQRTLFETLLYRTIREGEGPSATSGGTLPFQIGTGSTVATVQRDFRQGALEGTSFPSDLAIDGDGFFILNDGTGRQVFTRDGSFRLDAAQTLVSSNGAAVQVFPADAEGNVQLGTLSGLTIPLGSASDPIPTTEVVMSGQLDSGTALAAQPAVIASQALVTQAGTPAAPSTSLTDLVDQSGVPFFQTGDELRIGASKGGVAIQETAFVIGTDGTTLGDLAAHIQSAFGLDVDPTTGGGAGVVIGDGTTGPAGALVVTSNRGQINAVTPTDLSIINRTGPMPSPFTFSQTAQSAGGGEVTTSFVAFDSLGNPVAIRLRLALETKEPSGTTWRFYAESVADSDLSPLLGTGTISFDAQGRFVGATGTDLSVQREGSGAASPLTFLLDFSPVTAFASPDQSSQLIMQQQDGAPAGILIGYSIDPDGIVRGSYSNQLTQVLGQIAVATFRNNEGLLAQSDNIFLPGVNSGEPVIVAPRTGTAGAIISGALEQSNVEIAREFLNLITASTGIASASRVVRVADDLLQELLLIVR